MPTHETDKTHTQKSFWTSCFMCIRNNVLVVLAHFAFMAPVYAETIRLNFPVGYVGQFEGGSNASKDPKNNVTFDQLGIDYFVIQQETDATMVVNGITYPAFTTISTTAPLQGNDTRLAVYGVYSSGMKTQLFYPVLNFTYNSKTTFGLFLKPAFADVTGYYSEFYNVALMNGGVENGDEGISFALVDAQYTVGGGASFDIDIDGKLTNSANNPGEVALNNYLAALYSSGSLPAGPVTVTAQNICDEQATLDLIGNATLKSGESLIVNFNDVNYYFSVSEQTNTIEYQGDSWSIQGIDASGLTGNYDVTASINNSTGYSISDSSFDEISIDSAHCFVAEPSLSLVKTGEFNDVNNDGFANVDETISYSFTVTNTGNVTVSNITISDKLVETVTGEKIELAPGASDNSTFSATYVITQADIDAGEVLNQALASGEAPGGNLDDTNDDVTADSGTAAGNTSATVTSLPSEPVLFIEKIVDERDLADGVRAGVDKLYYTITVRNDGNVSLHDLALTDTMTDLNGGALSLDGPAITDATADAYSDGILSVGETWIFTAVYTLTPEAIATGGVNNIASIEALDPQDNPVTAESKVGGNTTDDGDPTLTGFPGEISGSVIEYQAGVPNIIVYLLEENSLGEFDYVIDLETNGRVTTTTDQNGDYVFVGLPAGTYGVEFVDPQASTAPRASSSDYTENANRITGIAVGAGAVEIDQDAFLVDPSGVVYDSLSYAPLSGAVVTLYYQASSGAASTVVPDDWLDTTIGDANGVTTATDGEYNFYLDPSEAQDGIYSLQVTKAGYNYVSQIIEPNVGPYNPGLGGAVVNISSDITPSETMDTNYYTSFSMVFDASNISTTSNGVVQNHLPMDASTILEIEEDLTEILKDDLAATMSQQSRQMSSFAAGALNRLKQRDANTCAADIADILEQEPVQFATASAVILPQSAGTLNAIAGLLETCPEATFEVAGHTDDRASDEYNLQLSRARAASVVAALRQRGVPVDRLASAGYGESRPISDNATEEGRQLNRRVEFVPLEAQAIEMPCRDMTGVDRNIDLQANENGISGNGDFTSETRDCTIDGWRIFSGSASYLETDDGIAQGMFSLNYRVERFVNNDRVSGWFVGTYSAKDDITGLATGTINGFGLNGGIYGALRLQDRLFADYYLGAAAGRHTFKLDFDRPLGTINVDGFYTYYALFAGSALSGELDVSNYVIAPRVGVDLAWSPGAEADLTASRAGFEEAGSLSTGTVSGGRLFAEASLVDLLVDQPAVLSFTPRVFCDRGIGSTKNSCGYGATMEFSSENEKTDQTFGVAFDIEGADDSERYALTVNMGQPLFGGQLETTGLVTQSGNLDLGLNFTIEY